MFLPVYPFIFFFVSCTNSSTQEAGSINREKEPFEKQSFFPVTHYIKGQLYEIKNMGINPLKFTTYNNHTDSVWLKIEELDDAVKEFLQPVIDTANLITLFTETKFADQSLDAFTFTYDATGILPDTMTWKHWDVYIDPATGKVKRLYLVKDAGNRRILQLTWQSNKWCKISTLNTDQNGVISIEKEEKIIWEF